VRPIFEAMEDAGNDNSVWLDAILNDVGASAETHHEFPEALRHKTTAFGHFG